MDLGWSAFARSTSPKSSKTQKIVSTGRPSLHNGSSTCSFVDMPNMMLDTKLPHKPKLDTSTLASNLDPRSIATLSKMCKLLTPVAPPTH
eukprot:1067287-Amphidinium_carterae.1